MQSLGRVGSGAGQVRDHGGGLDGAVAAFGGRREDWLDLSTGINPVAYPVGDIAPGAWGSLPDRGAVARLEAAARDFWGVPEAAAVLAVPGASAPIALMPMLAARGRVRIPGPTYNEHAAAFALAGWDVWTGPGGQGQGPEAADALVLVHPNNPDGRIWSARDAAAGLVVIDESFCDVMPGASLIGLAARPGVLVLKSFGKFWGLAGLRLGFAIGDRALLARLADLLGPWPVSGPALEIGARALADQAWAGQARLRLAADARRLDALVGWRLAGGTDLFRLYEVGDAAAVQAALARGAVWSRAFPYEPRWLRLGLPRHATGWAQLAAAADGVR